MTLGRQTRSRGRGRERPVDQDREQDLVTESVVTIRRVAKTVAGGRRFTFNALVVVGDGQGHVGYGLGKASEVPEAVQKGAGIARRAMLAVSLSGNTVPQQVVSRFRGSQILLKPAAPGTGVRASAAVRAVVQAAGVRDILTKSLGSNNPINVVQATLNGLRMMRAPQDVRALRRLVRGEAPVEPSPALAEQAASEPARTPSAAAPPPESRGVGVAEREERPVGAAAILDSSEPATEGAAEPATEEASEADATERKAKDTDEVAP